MTNKQEKTGDLCAQVTNMGLALILPQRERTVLCNGLQVLHVVCAQYSVHVIARFLLHKIAWHSKV